MKLLYYLLPLFGAISVASELAAETCQCPQVKCPGDDPVVSYSTNPGTLLQRTCINDRAFRLCATASMAGRPCARKGVQNTNQHIWHVPVSKFCKQQTANTVFKPCPAKPSPTPSAKPTTKPITCECPLVNCLAIWPGGCHCKNTAAQNCYDKCGGAPPKLQDCSTDPTFPQPTQEPEPSCECESVMCIQMWPESCYCANAAAEACHAKCGGPKPNLQVCHQRM